MAAFAFAAVTGCSQQSSGPVIVELAPATQDIRFASATCTLEDPFEAGQTAAQRAKAGVGDASVQAVVISECFEEATRKEKVLAGVCSVFDEALVFGSSTYGSFTQAGSVSDESACVMVIAGEDIAVESACQRELGTAMLNPADHEDQIRDLLLEAGASLAGKLSRSNACRLMIVIADAHSPKNGHLIEGMHSVVGADFPLIGGSANKNAGQAFVYYQGEMLADSAIALMLSGEFEVALAGSSAKTNDAVITTARQASARALEGLQDKGACPAAAFAFDCAGRKGKLDNVGDELTAIQESLGCDMPLFGSYNAGEIGPADVTDKKPDVLSSGVGWHIMVAVIGW